MIRLTEIFQNGMVLQRGKPVAVWGTAAPSAEIHAAIQSKVVQTKADVRFAKTAWYLVNLYNKAGIPAVPFMLNTEA